MVSRNGVELPLAGGPQSGPIPSCAWISRALEKPRVSSLTNEVDVSSVAYRLEYRRLVKSCGEGDDDPPVSLVELGGAEALLPALKPLPLPIGNRNELFDGVSTGEVADEPEREAFEPSWGM
jgi:hypothetical protein